MAIDDPDEWVTYNHRIAVLPGDPRVAYRPGRVLFHEDGREALVEIIGDGVRVQAIFDSDIDPPLGQWFAADGVENAPAVVAELRARGVDSNLDIVYFANSGCCDVCPPHPALAAEIAANPWGANPWGANPWGANPWGANPWGANPWGANPWGANPWAANPEALNIVATGKPPMSSVMPAPDRSLPLRSQHDDNHVVIGVLDSGLAGGPHNDPPLRPELLLDLDRITGHLDEPSRSIPGRPDDEYLDPVAGHGTFIAGIIEQLTPGCTIDVRQVFEPEGDVSVAVLTSALVSMMEADDTPTPDLVCLSLGGTGRASVLEHHIAHYSAIHHADRAPHAEHCPGHEGHRPRHHDHHHHHHHHHDHCGGHGHPPHDHAQTVFVASAGNEGSCVEQFPAALPEVIGVGALGPTGPAPWSNYGPWLDASAPGTDLVSSFFAEFDGALPDINGMDADEFVQWATWSGTSFAGPVVIAALAREMITSRRCAAAAAQAVIRAPHLARFPNMGTIVNY